MPPPFEALSSQIKLNRATILPEANQPPIIDQSTNENWSKMIFDMWKNLSCHQFIGWQILGNISSIDDIPYSVNNSCH